MHLFELMAEPVRRRIVEILASGEHTATELSNVLLTEFHIGRPSVSHHLRVLRENDFVEVREEGSTRVYRLMWNALDRLDREVEHLWDLWDSRIGYPYRNDTLAVPRAYRGSRRGRRGRTQPADRSEVERTAGEDLWWH